MGSKLRYFIESRRNGQDSQVSGDNYRVLRYCGQFNGAREKLVLVLIVSVVVVVSLLSPISPLSDLRNIETTPWLSQCLEWKPINQSVDFNTYQIFWTQKIPDY